MFLYTVYFIITVYDLILFKVKIHSPVKKSVQSMHNNLLFHDYSGIMLTTEDFSSSLKITAIGSLYNQCAPCCIINCYGVVHCILHLIADCIVYPD